MDTMVSNKLFNNIYHNKRVFITGHTGFKGSWLAYWLYKMGAVVKGYSLAPNTSPNHWELLGLDINSVYGDIRDQASLEKELNNFKPDIVFHLAAQAIVRQSYTNPVETYDINIMGTLKLFEACRKQKSIQAIVNITSDKCYANKEWVYGYRENDAMGGFDPYSSSKGSVELLTDSYRNSYWNLEKYEVEHNVLLTSCRAGNVIGGGDWAQDRLIPDVVRSVTNGNAVKIRNPYATRPWQHVLDPLSGYLLIGQKLLEKKVQYASGWNFGPSDEGSIPVGKVLEIMQNLWSKIRVDIDKSAQPHEANLLKLDCSKAHIELEWKPAWTSNEVFKKTTVWYMEFDKHKRIDTSKQIDEYVAKAEQLQLIWAK